MKTVRHSIGLNWLRRINRHLPTPRLIVTSPDEMRRHGSGGFYAHPFDRDYFVGDLLVPATRSGVIVACDFDSDEWDLGACIAHEWRHHWQRCHGIRAVISKLRSEEQDDSSVDQSDPLYYEKHIVRYFLGSPTEMDALRFECRHAPASENLWRMANCRHWARFGEVLAW